MKRFKINYCIVVLLWLIATPVYSQYGYEKDKISHEISGGVSANIKKGLEAGVMYCNVLYGFNSHYAKAVCGFQFQKDTFAFLIKAAYSPLNILKHRININAAYNVCAIKKTGTEHNLLTSAEYIFLIPDKCIMHFEAGYMHKVFNIPIKSHKPIIINTPSMIMGIGAEAIIAKQWFLGFSATSYETFRYPLFANPSFTCSLNYHLKRDTVPKMIFAGLAFTLRYSDIFTLSGYPENFVIKTAVGVEL